jgi:hypothetical protein
MTEIILPREAKAQRWRELLAEQAASGKSVCAFCEERQIQSHSFKYWSSRFPDFKKTRIKKHPSSRFISVSRQDFRSAAPRILLPNGVTIDLSAGLDDPVVGAFLKSLCGINGGPHAKS